MNRAEHNLSKHNQRAPFCIGCGEKRAGPKKIFSVLSSPVCMMAFAPVRQCAPVGKDNGAARMRQSIPYRRTHDWRKSVMRRSAPFYFETGAPDFLFWVAVREWPRQFRDTNGYFTGIARTLGIPPPRWDGRAVSGWGSDEPDNTLSSGSIL
jgi:hypothetical protein